MDQCGWTRHRERNQAHCGGLRTRYIGKLLHKVSHGHHGVAFRGPFQDDWTVQLEIQFDEQRENVHIEIPEIGDGPAISPLFMSAKPSVRAVTFRSVSELVVAHGVPDVGIGMRINEITEKVYVYLHKIIQNYRTGRWRLCTTTFRLTNTKSCCFKTMSPRYCLLRFKKICFSFRKTK